jgi:hypothetical protein
MTIVGTLCDKRQSAARPIQGYRKPPGPGTLLSPEAVLLAPGV